MTKYLKAIVAVLGAVLTTVLATFPDNPDVQHWGAIISSFLTAILVYFLPNTPATDQAPPA
jgi:peptidoglycan/LPS O-acetylase OafA/YrhL